MGNYRTFGTALDRVFRNDLNNNFSDIANDINAQKTRVDNLITGTPQPSEVVDARGGKTVLKDRLDAVDVSLADKAKRLWVDITESPYNASTTNSASANTTAIQTALDTGKHVFIPDGTFNVNNVSLNTDNQRLAFSSKAKLSSSYAGDVVTLNADFAGLDDAYIICSGSVTAGIKTNGFRNLLRDCTVTGTSVNALVVNGLETIINFGKYKGGTTAGLNIQKQDCYANNVYTEGNRDGVYLNGIGSMVAHHIHAFGNTRHGFYLSGASYSQLTACYADTNGSNGYEIRDTTSGLTLTDCWGYKSANITANQYDFAFYNAKNVKMVGCHSNGSGAFNKLASFYFDSTSQVDMIGCHSEISPSGTFDLVRFTNCSGALLRYNRAIDVYQSLSYTITANTSSTISIRTMVPNLSSTPGIHSFEVNVSRRNTDNTGASIERCVLVIGSGVTIGTPVITVFPVTPIITISSPTFTDGGDGYFNLGFTALNTNATKDMQLSFNVRYLGTGRGFS